MPTNEQKKRNFDIVFGSYKIIREGEIFKRVVPYNVSRQDLMINILSLKIPHNMCGVLIKTSLYRDYDIKNMKTMVSILKDMERDNYFIVLNEASDVEKNCFSKYDIKNILKSSIDYVIPNSFYQKDIDEYVLDGKIMTMTKRIQTKDKKAMKVFEMLTDALLGKKVKK